MYLKLSDTAWNWKHAICRHLIKINHGVRNADCVIEGEDTARQRLFSM